MVKSVRNVISSIQKGDIDPVYLLQGDDQYLQQLVIIKIEGSLFNNQPRDKTILIPDELSGPEIMERLIKTDLFSSRKLFILRNPQQLRQPYRKELLNYCKNPIVSHCLVIIIEEYGSRSKIIQELAQRVQAISVQTPFEQELRKWIKYFFSENGIKAGTAVINAVLDIAGDSVYHIANEVEKICIALDNGEELSVDLVYQFSGWRREHRRWEFLTAVGNKDLKKATQLGMSIIMQNETMLSLLYPLTTLFEELLFEKITPGNLKERSGYIPLSQSVIKKIPRFVKHYSKRELEKALFLLGTIDERIKSISTPDESEITRFLFNVLVENE